MTKPILIATDQYEDMLNLGSLLRAWYDRGLVRVVSSLGDGGLEGAHSSLFIHPEIPVAVVLNADSDKSATVDEMRRDAMNVLAWAALGGWTLAIASPNTSAWIEDDPVVRRLIGVEPGLRTNLRLRAFRTYQATVETPLDLGALRASNREIRRILDFVEAHSAETTQAAAG